MKSLMFLVLNFFAVSCLTSSLLGGTVLAEQHGSSQAVAKAYLRRTIEQTHTPGASFAVVRDDRLVQAGGYGMANVETNTPADAQTVYKIASLSKSFISAAVVLLIKEQKLRADAAACSFLVGCPDSWKPITIYQLLTHTAGLVRDPLDYQPYVDQPISAIIHSAYTIPLQSTPGSKWLYSNLGYYVLAEIVTKATGELWSDFVAKNILGPAGLTATQLSSATTIIPHRANGYQWKDDKLTNAENWIANRPSSAYVSNVLDLVKWNAYLERQVAADPMTWGAVWKASRLPDGSSTRYGFGWYSDRYLGQTRIHHEGEYPGFRTEIDRFPQDHLTVIVLANSDGFPAERSSLALAGIFDFRLKAPEFSIECEAPSTSTRGKPVPLRVKVTDLGVGSEDTVVEIEIWDQSGKSVYKDNLQQLDFKAGQNRSELFSWTPQQAGTFTLNIGVYGPRWLTSFAWKQEAATLHVF